LETLEQMLARIETGAARRRAIPLSLEMLPRDRNEAMTMPQNRRDSRPRFVTRFLGGPPLSVLFRLALLSIWSG